MRNGIYFRFHCAVPLYLAYATRDRLRAQPIRALAREHLGARRRAIDEAGGLRENYAPEFTEDAIGLRLLGSRVAANPFNACNMVGVAAENEASSHDAEFYR